MKKFSYMVCGVLLASGLIVSSASAGVVAVANFSFEDDAMTGFGSQLDPLTGWTRGNPLGLPGNPIAGLNDEDTGAFTAPDGEQVAWVNSNYTLSQVVTETLTAGTIYDLTVAVGSRNDLGSPLTGHSNSYDVQLRAGGVILAQTAGGPLGAGTPFFDVLVSYAPIAGDLQLGQPLEIVLAGSTQPQYDNVRLTSTVIPEPSSLALLSLGMVGLVGNSRRRKS